MSEDRAHQAANDLADVDEQERIGELDHATAERLRAVYRRELAAAREEAGPADQPSQQDEGRSRSKGRVLAGAIIVVVAVAVIAIAADRALTDRDGGFITGAAAGSGSDLESISNEAMIDVIRANEASPQINAMKLALAERYFEAGQYPEAFDWFEEVLDGDPSPAEASEALGRMGWMVYSSGEPAVAESTLGQALELNPDNGEAELFLGLLYLETDRPGEALDRLAMVAARDDLTDEIRDLVEAAIADAEARL